MKNFLKEWEPQLKDVGFILYYLHTYPDALKNIRIEDLIIPDELPERLGEWHWLYSKYNDAEKKFFKPYWIPIQRDGYDYFLDISDSKYPIIEAFYNYFDEPYHWEKKIFFKSVSNLMLVEDNNIDLEKYRIDKIMKKYDKYIS